jgi:hypothetical protein
MNRNNNVSLHLVVAVKNNHCSLVSQSNKFGADEKFDPIKSKHLESGT